MSQEDFILQAKAKGYGDWREILPALEVKSTREVREMGYRQALERLPDRKKAESEAQAAEPPPGTQEEPTEGEADLAF